MLHDKLPARGACREVPRFGKGDPELVGPMVYARVRAALLSGRYPLGVRGGSLFCPWSSADGSWDAVVGKNGHGVVATEGGKGRDRWEVRRGVSRSPGPVVDLGGLRLGHLSRARDRKVYSGPLVVPGF